MDDASLTTKNDDCTTLVLTRSQIAGVMTANDYLLAAEEAFRALATGTAIAPPPLHIATDGGGFHAKGATLRNAGGRHFAAVKVNGNFPNNPKSHGLPTIQGAIVLSDASNGRLLALLDTIEVTLRRTAAATALAATHLARPNAKSLAVIGCGDQALAQLAALAGEFRFETISAWDTSPKAIESFSNVASSLGLQVTHARNLHAATKEADIVVTCTTSREPILDIGDVKPGAFIAAVGADHPYKSETAPRLMARARVVVDVLDQCAVMGDLHHAIAAGVMTAQDVHASLGALIVGQHPGRETPDEITLFDSTGTAVQDVAAAARIYERARADRIGTPFHINR